MKLLLGLSVALVTVLAASVAGAQASRVARISQDSLAPPGASARWLPCEDWVMHHWIPYDEQQLFSMLATNRAEVERWLARDDVHTLAQLVRRRGLDPTEVAAQLVSVWAGDAPRHLRAVLYDRALRTLTQGHLAQHLFFHFAHYPAVALRAKTVFGIAPLAYQRYRMAGWTPSEIGRRHGREPAAIRQSTLPILRRGAGRGAAQSQTPPSQARRVLALQRANLGAWLGQRIRPLTQVRRMDVPRLRGSREMACWLFAGETGLQQLRRPVEAEPASFICSVAAAKRKAEK